MDKAASQHGLQLLVVLHHVIVLGQLLEHHLAGLLLRSILFVADLEQATFFDNAIESAAVMATKAWKKLLKFYYSRGREIKKIL